MADFLCGLLAWVAWRVASGLTFWLAFGRAESLMPTFPPSPTSGQAWAPCRPSCCLRGAKHSNTLHALTQRLADLFNNSIVLLYEYVSANCEQNCGCQKTIGNENVKLRANAHVMENATHKCEYKHVCKCKCSYEPNNKMEL